MSFFLDPFRFGAAVMPGEVSPFYPSILLSTRKRRAAYSGACVRVRRSSDNNEQDIGWVSDGAGGYIIDGAAITSFCSGTSGFVTKWYDQGLNARNAVQTTSSLQPAIYQSGALEQISGRVCPRFDATSFLQINNCAELDLTGDFAKEVLLYKIADGSGGFGQSRLLDCRSFGDSSLDMLYAVGTAVRVYRNSDHAGGVGLSLTTLTNLAYSRESSTWRQFAQGSHTSAQNFTDAKDLSGSVQGIGADSIAGAGLNGYIQELRITKGAAVRTADYTAWGMS